MWSPGGAHAQRGAVLLALVGEHLLDAADLDVGEVPAHVGDERVHAAAVERRLGGARLLAGARPALARHRARGQLHGREQRRRQPARHLAVVAPLHAAQQLLADLHALAQLYLRTSIPVLARETFSSTETICSIGVLARERFNSTKQYLTIILISN